METQKLPSALQIGDYADVIIWEGASLLDEESILTACKVINVHFGLGSVRYDFEALVSIDNETKTRHVTRIYNIDSAFVHKRTPHHIDGMRGSKIDKINRYFSENVFDASWKKGTVTPGDIGDEMSDEFLVDVSGNREHFVIGWYDHGLKSWQCEAKLGYNLDSEKIMYQSLPLAKYDK